MSRTHSRAKSAFARMPAHQDADRQQSNEFPRPAHAGLPPKLGLRRNMLGSTADAANDQDYFYCKTRYDQDFAGASEGVANVCRGVARPTSPTRLNNPHPSRTFMRWTGNEDEMLKDGPTLAEVKAAVESDKKPWFRKDFKEIIGQDIPDDKVQEYLRTFTRVKLPYDQPESSMIGIHTRLKSDPPAKPKKLVPKRSGKDAPVAKTTLHRTLRDPEAVHTMDAFLKTADPEAQKTISKMMDAADKSYLSKEARQHFLPAAGPGMEKWLAKSKPEERHAAADFFKSLHGSSGAPPRPSARQQGVAHGRSRSENSALTRPQQDQQFLRRHTHADINAPMLWHLKSVRDPPYDVPNRSAIYNPPHRYRGVHFNIHPEWPTYME
ncbi:uncharacterized protein LOC135818820 [Sycon ciliatum]|uniref:uncharacterized protein LOC135818820 n=1 Tax=Sycon ciliatum TaxID=27933 RepID=UPI0020AEE8F5|eukprot:scpid79228/ scgid19826/ 